MSEQQEQSQLWQALSFAGGLAFFVLVPLGIGLVAGLWLDSKLQSTPLFLLVGSLLGIVGATYGLWRKARKIFEGD
ncbi:AtpZ/AtpI family protein [Patescibacteria group bacterium]|nr:AtpZ/AtpI family protein [Patescibacteria group bacterium]